MQCLCDTNFSMIFCFILLFSFLDQNFYYQSPQRFQPSFQNPRNGFFPSNGVPGLLNSQHIARGPPPLGSFHEQTLFGDDVRAKDASIDLYPHSSFAVSLKLSFLSILPKNLYS